MNYDINELPESGENPVVYFDISIGGQKSGRIYIKLFRDLFPAGVENFVLIAAGTTYRTQVRGCGKGKYVREVQRTYSGCKFFHKSFERYIISGDIYSNTGRTAGTIFNDEPIPEDVGPDYIPHESLGIVSLVPFIAEETGEPMYDSTFLITLANAKPSNNLCELDEDSVAIGYVCEGLDVLNCINESLVPFAGRNYPEIKIENSGVFRSERPHRTPRSIIESACLTDRPCQSHPRCQTRRNINSHRNRIKGRSVDKNIGCRSSNIGKISGRC